MRVRSVTAHAFGPLRGETLRLADGMTVVVGANESAKSSWHSAIYAAVCGRRRARGRPREDEQRFADLHKPWDDDDWLVSAELALDDGRRIEMRQDLAGRVDCHAFDLDVAEDVSAQVINDGAPDGARWLGLSRSSFVATACVEQAGMLRVLSDAGGLQELLQRAAATAGADATAAAALERLEAFQRDRVGLDRAGSQRPLRRALDEVRVAEEALRAAEEAHEAYLRRVGELDELRGRADAAEDRLRLHEAADAAATARRLAERRDRVATLRAALGDRAPSGDVELAPGVGAGLDEVREASVRLRAHEDARPPAAEEPGPLEVADDELLALAHTLDGPPPEVPEGLLREEEAARLVASAAERRGRVALLLLLGGVVTALVGAGLLAGGATAAGAGLLAVAALLLGAAAARRRGGGAAATRLAAAKAAVAAERRRVSEGVVRRGRAAARCAALGLPVDPSALRRVPAQRAQAAGLAEEAARWAQTGERLGTELRAATDRLAGALSAAGEAWEGDALEDVLAAAERHREAAAARATRAVRGWAELQALLDGSAPAALEREADGAEEAARRQARLVDPAALAALDGPGAAEQLPELRARATALAQAVATEEGALRLLAASVTSVAEAEEARALAGAELERVRRLQETLELTRGFLAEAQRRVHRDVAPVLAATVGRWLPRVTAGRYTEVRVDPTSLEVSVCGPSRRWRDAARLSHGTAEQVYLLLRVALADHLTAGFDTCPLLLDDVTVHADAERTGALLELLRELAAERQVVLFTQEEQVAAWARTRLVPGRDALVELSPVAAGPHERALAGVDSVWTSDE